MICHLFQFVKSFIVDFEPSLPQQLMFSVYDIDSRWLWWQISFIDPHTSMWWKGWGWVPQFTFITKEMPFVHNSAFANTTGIGGGRVVKLLACQARGSGFESRSRHLNFRYWVSPASKQRYDWEIVRKSQLNQYMANCMIMLIKDIKVTNEWRVVPFYKFCLICFSFAGH